VIEDPELLRQIVRDRHESLLGEVANDRLARSASIRGTDADLITRAMKGLLHGLVAAGVATAIFAALTVSVQFWLATATSREPGGYPYPVPSYAHVTPDPHPEGHPVEHR
jgi:hypothetical protein